MRKSKFTIQRAEIEDAAEIARVYRRSYNAALSFIPTRHTPDQDLQFFSEQILPKHEVFVARDETARIVGFIAFDDEWVKQLYLLADYTRRGIGDRLMNIAKRQRTKLRLWAFKRNENAINFYSSRGFVAIEETDGSGNEEKEPAVLFEWVNK